MATLVKMLVVFLQILPDDPFLEIMTLGDVLSFLPVVNWVIPFQSCAGILYLWCVAMGAWYSYNSINWLIQKIFK